MPLSMPLFTDNLGSLYSAMMVAALTIAGLYLGADILIPLAIATILAFILSPIVQRLVRWKLPRGLAVMLVLTGSVAGTVVLTVLLSSQILSLTAELGSYRANLVEKARWISSLGTGDGTIKRASDAIENLGTAIQSEFGPAERAVTPASPATPSTPAETQAPAEPETGHDMTTIMDVLTAPLAKAALTLLFTLFLLLQYEDIRDRVIRLAGTDNISGTTAAMGDAGSRLSKLFLTQTTLNVSFGIFIGVALAIIGVPNPILWGAVAGVMRFVPFIGTLIAAAPPVLLAAGVDPGWTMAIATLLLFVIAEPIMGHVVEPSVLGRSVGLSPFVMVVSASFWMLIWGPIGLLLAAPLTMLLVILGRYVPRLEFASILLGDQRALEPHQDLYRRILSGDTTSTIAQVEEAVEEAGLVHTADTCILPALRTAAADNRRGRIEETRKEEIAETVRDLVAYLEELPIDRTDEPVVLSRNHVLVVPARGLFDELAADIVAATLQRAGRIEADVTTGSSGLSALANRKAGDQKRVFDAIMLVSAGGLDSRLLAILAKRAAATFPDARIFIFDMDDTPAGVRPANLPDGITRMTQLAEACAALDFAPTRTTPAAGPTPRSEPLDAAIAAAAG